MNRLRSRRSAVIAIAAAVALALVIGLTVAAFSSDDDANRSRDTTARTTATKAPATSASSTTTTTRPATPTTLPVGGPPGSLARDCSADVTPGLQAWIDAAPNNSILPFPAAPACYRINATLLVENRVGLTFEGNGVTLKAVSLGNRTRQHFVISGGARIIVRNVVVRGANHDAGGPSAYDPDLEAQHAFQVSGATNVLLEDVQAYDLYGDFVYIGPGRNMQPSRLVRVIKSQFARSGRQGISVVHAENVTIQGNRLDDVARSMFDIEPNDPKHKARSIRILNNITGYAKNFWLAQKGAVSDIGDILIANNRMTEATGGLFFVFAPSGPYRGPFVIEKNTFIANDKVIDEGSSGAFFFSRAKNVTIRDNNVTFPTTGDMTAVELRDSHQVQVTGNTFRNAGEMMLATEGSSDYQVN